MLVEHDLEVINRADHLIDIGPGAGHYGGKIIASGTPGELALDSESLTGQYLSHEQRIPIPHRRLHNPARKITISNAKANNLKNISVDIPKGCLTVVTGVSGSGKSSLIIDVLQKAVAKKLSGYVGEIGEHKTIKGLEQLKYLRIIDQEPIGRTPEVIPQHTRAHCLQSGNFFHNYLQQGKEDLLQGDFLLIQLRVDVGPAMVKDII